MRASAAAFDTRLAGPAMFTGRAAKGTATLLERHSLALIAPAESFLVTTDNTLRPGEEDPGQEWGETVAARMRTATEVRP